MQRKIINPVIQDTVTFVRTSAETAGRFTELVLTLRPGGGPPPHFHTRFTETFTAIEGELVINTSAAQPLVLRPGDSYTVPIGAVHSFTNASAQEITFRAVIRPGHEGFENSLRLVYGLAADGLTDAKSVPKQFTHLAIMAVLGDLNLPGLRRVLAPVLRWVAHRAQRKGTMQALLAKYLI
ncbi:cupin domain-containing protein [Hymenobacter negativus]|uniref:Cupin domain-containing protein n=1 Tax=Hymenobacter negativus TaxID=2795026 RepID=A0ABS3QFE3_9BACT|nr:cupin domain-containing protein [Hymenobacter negativus]MBO2009971.1 cupin domain-containing protein [Hymenobacter negativus]